MNIQIARMLHCGNHKVFGKDVEHRLADLEHTKGEINHVYNDYLITVCIIVVVVVIVVVVQRYSVKKDGLLRTRSALIFMKG